MKKALLILLALVMSVNFLACAPKDDTKPGATDGGTAAGGTEAKEPEVTSEYQKPAADLSGKEFIFAGIKQDSPNWTARTYTEVYAEELNDDIINDAIYNRIAAVEETLGITILSKTYNTIDVMQKTTLAGDHYADTVLLSGISFKTMLSAGLLTDMNAIPTLDLKKSWWDQNAVESLSIGGKLYAAPGDIAPFGNLAIFSTYVNKGIVKNYNLDDPYELVRSGKWTFDAMTKMGREVAADLNNDNKMDGEDIFGLNAESGLMPVALLASGVNFTQKDENDFPKLTINSERTANIIDKIVPVYRDKSVTLYATDFSSSFTNVFSQFMTPMFIKDQLLFINNWLVVALELRNMESDFGILPPPKFDEAQEKYLAPSSETWTMYAVVPITNTNLDSTGYVMDALGYYGQQEIKTALIDRTITSKTLRDTDTEEMLEIMFSNRVYDLATIFGWGMISNLASLAGGTTNWSSFYATSETTTIAAIEATIESLK